jgi:hypothetical protein
MSSIENVSGVSADLLQLRQLLARQSGSSSDVSQTGTARGNDARRADFDAKFKAAALAAGLDPTAADSLQDEIDAAVSAVAQTSDSSADQRETIKGAIDAVLQKHGVDLEKFKSEMESGMRGAGGPPPNGPPPSGARQADFEAKFTQAAVAAGLDPTEADGLQDEIKSAIDEVLKNADSSSDPRQSIQAAIDKLLKEHGVDLTTFKSQLQSLTGDSQGRMPLVDEQA